MSFGLCNSVTNRAISSEEIDKNFDDLHHPLNQLQAETEASRCLYCYDAPCITACPTSIDIPTFIHQIRTENVHGSAKTILSENIMGGTCARACPTEILCEQACVLNASVEQPINIGSLQRFAVDSLIFKKGASNADAAHPFTRQNNTGKSLAIIGAGPAGLSCAHRAAMLGNEVTIFEAKSKPGGLNEYGLAAYKMVDDFAQKEVEFLLGIGGINIKYERRLNENVFLNKLQNEFDAVFIGVGLGSVNKLGINGENDASVIDAIEFIEGVRQASDKSSITVGNNVIVIGAGNTAIDAAIQAKRLGAENVTLVYRRDEQAMSATEWEVDLARRNQVKIIFWAAPDKYDAENSVMVFNKTSLNAGKLVVTDQSFELPSDMVLTAIGQKLDQQLVIQSSEDQQIDTSAGKIVISENYQTSLKGVFAGGDCIKGADLTVQAVQDGKLAAHAIHNYLMEQE